MSKKCHENSEQSRRKRTKENVWNKKYTEITTKTQKNIPRSRSTMTPTNRTNRQPPTKNNKQSITTGQNHPTEDTAIQQRESSKTVSPTINGQYGSNSNSSSSDSAGQWVGT